MDFKHPYASHLLFFFSSSPDAFSSSSFGRGLCYTLFGGAFIPALMSLLGISATCLHHFFFSSAQIFSLSAFLSIPVLYSFFFLT